MAIKKIYTIGRDESCDIVIPDNTDIISRLHATIRIESNDKIFLTDQSRNGTYINGMKMSSNVEIPVSRKDVISFAHIYNLDWTLIPAYKKNIFKRILIVILIFLVLACSVLAVVYLLSVRTQSEQSALPQSSPEPIVTIKSDTIVVRDTVIVETEKEDRIEIQEKVEEKKDTVIDEKPLQEIYNPIY